MAKAKRGVGQHHGELRPALIEAAIALLARGEDGFSLRAVAREAGVSAGAPYHHFADKEALLAAVALEGFIEFEAALQEATRSKRSAASKLRARGKTYVSFALAHLAHYQTMFSSEIDMPSHPELERVGQGSFFGLVQVMLEAGATSESEARRRAGMAWALAHGAVVLAAKDMLAGAMNVDADAIGRHVGETMVVIAGLE